MDLRRRLRAALIILMALPVAAGAPLIGTAATDCPSAMAASCYVHPQDAAGGPCAGAESCCPAPAQPAPAPVPPAPAAPGSFEPASGHAVMPLAPPEARRAVEVASGSRNAGRALLCLHQTFLI
jgi:hypothetical protein